MLVHNKLWSFEAQWILDQIRQAQRLVSNSVACWCLPPKRPTAPVAILQITNRSRQ
jgi:hypothetical protein